MLSADPAVDAFRDLLNQAVPQNIQFGDGSDDKGLAPVLTFSTPDNPAGITPINLFTSGSPGDGHC